MLQFQRGRCLKQQFTITKICNYIGVLGHHFASRFPPSCLCYNHWCHTVWTQTLERRPCCFFFFSFPRQILPCFVLIMLSEHVSEFPVFLFSCLCRSHNAATSRQQPIMLFFYTSSRPSYGMQSPALHLCALSRCRRRGENKHTRTHTDRHTTKTKKLPRHQEKALCFFVFAADMRWCVRACAVEALEETQPRTQIRRKTSEGKVEKAAKAVSGNDAMKGPPRRNWFWQPAEKWASHTQMFTIHTHTADNY